MHGPIFSHGILRLISIVLCVNFVVHVNVNQGISTLLNLLMAHSGQTMVSPLPSVGQRTGDNCVATFAIVYCCVQTNDKT